jgi:uncharacterized protein (DUF302 family)
MKKVETLQLSLKPLKENQRNSDYDPQYVLMQCNPIAGKPNVSVFRVVGLSIIQL